MKLSLDWVSEFVDLSGIDVGELAEKLTVHTAEVDDVARVVRSVDRVVVARVLHTRRIEGSQQAVAAEIDIGGETLTTVCTAPNVRGGLVTLAALPGAVLASGNRIEASRMYGMTSAATLCSEHEVGLGSNCEGIVELPSKTRPGQALANLVASQDTVLEIDNKSITHRPDLWSHYGFAREIGAIFGRPITPLDGVDLQRYGELPALDIRINSDDCFYYSAIRFGVGGQGPSPLFVQSRLSAVGSRPRSLLVDLTNYVQFEIGQPTHVFDADRISAIVVANAKARNDVPTLDGAIRSLLPGDLLIQDGDRPVAIAGIIGGSSAEVTGATRQVVLESASFSGPRVRVTSMRLGLRTDASQRFEKKLPPLFAQIAPGRLLKLLERVGEMPQVTSRLSAVGSVDQNLPVIAVPAGYISARAGVDIDEGITKRILESIGFEVHAKTGTGLDVVVPQFRSTFDISSRDDIAEEVMRLYGYDAIQPSLPVAGIDSPPLNPVLRNHHRARRILAQSHGFVEVMSYSWYSAQWLQSIGYSPQRRTLDLRNPIGADRRQMRESLMPNLLAVAELNRAQIDDFRVFEIGKAFWIDENGDKQEANQLCGLVGGTNRSALPEEVFGIARAAVEDIARAAAMGPLHTQLGETAHAPWRSTAATVDILKEKAVVGALGILPSRLCSAIIGRGQIAWFTLDIDQLVGEVYPATAYAQPPVFPGSTQDFTFVATPNMNYAALESVLDRLVTNLSYKRSFVSVYRQPGEEFHRYTFRFEIFIPDRTLTSDDINSFREELVSLAERHGVRLL